MEFSKKILLLSIGLSMVSVNQTFAASSDGFPWSVPAQSVDSASVHVDQNGALTDMDSRNHVNSADTENFSEMAQGNVGATQSGPGASGLFTPNNPGNTAALSAQMHGGLEGSPIVDGVGSNLRVTVPLATPSLKPSYEQITNGGVIGVTHNTVLNDPPAAAAHTMQLQSSFSTVRTAAVATPYRRATNLGRVNGSIDFGNGDKVLFGSGGVESISRNKKAVLQLNDGRTITKKP